MMSRYVISDELFLQVLQLKVESQTETPEGICFSCLKDPVTNQRLGLCASCYNLLTRTCSISAMLFRKKNTQTVPPACAIKRVERIHGPEMIGDLKRLQWNPLYTLESVGKKHGITRERVRQIFNSVIQEDYDKFKLKKREGWRRRDHCAALHPTTITWSVLQKCNQLNLSTELLTRKHLLIYPNNGYNSKLVHVSEKRAEARRFPPNKQKYYGAIRRNQGSQYFDIHVVRVPHENAFFVVPWDMVTAENSYYIKEGQQEFRERWDLLA